MAEVGGAWRVAVKESLEVGTCEQLDMEGRKAKRDRKQMESI